MDFTDDFPICDCASALYSFNNLFKKNAIYRRKLIKKKETIKLIRASLPSTIEINYNIESQEDMMIADTTQIYQLIMNL